MSKGCLLMIYEKKCPITQQTFGAERRFSEDERDMLGQELMYCLVSDSLKSEVEAKIKEEAIKDAIELENQQRTECKISNPSNLNNLITYV